MPPLLPAQRQNNELNPCLLFSKQDVTPPEIAAHFGNNGSASTAWEPLLLLPGILSWDLC